MKHWLGIGLTLLSLCMLSSAELPAEDWERIEIEIQRQIGAIDYKEEFEKIRKDVVDFDVIWDEAVGIPAGAFVVLVLLLIIVPNLMILALIFLCCWGCQCGCFAYQRDMGSRVGPEATGGPGTVYQKPSLMPVRSRFSKPASRNYPATAAPMSPTGSVSAFQQPPNNNW